jgi:hypothetical protein
VVAHRSKASNPHALRNALRAKPATSQRIKPKPQPNT